ncbi:MAG TPA: hypothetical protein VFQ61_21975, partial [Polyangiaceae bacterium]|nr:hypothetical protein [Polyangiaceae bacterium]
MKLVYWLVWQHRVWLLGVLALSGLSASISVGVIALIHELIATDSVLRRVILARFCGLLLALFVTGVASQLIVSWLGHGAVYRLRRVL